MSREEIFDIVDENGRPTGATATRTEAHASGLRHRTAHIWVVRMHEGRRQVLLQKRSACKDSNPGRWDTSSAGHIDAGETPLPSARRELAEELGIRAEEKQLAFIGTFSHRDEDVFYGKPFLDDEVSFVYVYDAPVDIATLVLQSDEVERVAWFDAEQVLAAVRACDPAFCLCPEGLEMVLGR